MKKNISLTLLVLSLVYSSQWVNIQSQNIDKPIFEVVNSNIENTVIQNAYIHIVLVLNLFFILYSLCYS